MEKYEVLLKNEDIQKKVESLAKELDKKYGQEPIVLLCILKGAVVFFSDLVRKMKNKNVEIDFIRAKSYSGTSTTGEVKLLLDTTTNIEGKNVVVVEDIVDSGYTANFLYDLLIERKPKDLLMCALIQKPTKLAVELKMPLLIGYKIEDKFIVGYGLDVDEKFRTLKDIVIYKK